MHEIGIANSILQASETELRGRPGATLLRVGIRVGVLSGVNIDSLRFAFDALTAGTELAAVSFDIQDCPRRERCVACGLEFNSEVYSRPCPACGTPNAQLIGGDELDLAYLEVEEA